MVLIPFCSFLSAIPLLTCLFPMLEKRTGANAHQVHCTSCAGNKKLSPVGQPAQKPLPGWNEMLGKANDCTRGSSSQKGALIPGRHAPLSGITTLARNVASAFLLSRHTIILPARSCPSHLLPINPQRGLHQTCQEAAVHRHAASDSALRRRQF